MQEVDFWYFSNAKHKINNIFILSSAYSHSSIVPSSSSSSSSTFPQHTSKPHFIRHLGKPISNHKLALFAHFQKD